MSNSLSIAQVLGPLLLFIGLGVLLNPNYYRDAVEDWLKNRALLMLWSTLIFAVGLLVVLSHNVWVKGWEVIVTIVGWLMLLKGALYLVFPMQMVEMEKPWLEKKVFMWGALFELVIGAALTYVGYFV